jgi:hypothetical protein
VSPVVPWQNVHIDQSLGPGKAEFGIITTKTVWQVVNISHAARNA